METFQGRNLNGRVFLPSRAPALGLDGSAIDSERISVQCAIFADERQRPRDERRSWQVARGHATAVCAEGLQGQRYRVKVRAMA
jgi:hypothetical protein